jgi:iron only hydrogenase large subunit-like protein
MDSYDSLYRDLMKAAFENRLDTRVKELQDNKGCDETELNLLLHPENQPPVIRVPGDCSCDVDEPSSCQLSCLFSAIHRDENGKIIISTDGCVGCAECIKSCTDGKLKERKDLLPLFEMLHEGKTPVFAMIAPAFIGQFSHDVTVGKLRNAFKKLGFQGMVEVALFADILTLKEALEFDRLVTTKEDFLLTSCCCPVWVAMIRRAYGSLSAHIPPSVSPMVACGRAIKKIHPDAKTVFIGPCLAKKGEIREPDIADAVDAVLTFQEVEDILALANIDIASLDDDHKDHSSMAGRIYARTGGVSRAVEQTLLRLKGERAIPLVAQQAEGVKECKALLESVKAGHISANFLEGMGCVGGCVGGPRVMIDPKLGEQNVNEYGAAATYETPVDNPYTFEFLKRLGYDSAEALLGHDNMFIRDF